MLYILDCSCTCTDDGFVQYTVSTQIESGVMQLIVEHVAITMETMSHDPHVTHWGCKVFAHAASNGETLGFSSSWFLPYIAFHMHIRTCMYMFV